MMEPKSAQELKLHDRWKYVLVLLRQLNPQPGHLITRAWLWEAYGFPPERDDMSWREGKQLQLLYAANTVKLFEALDEEQQIAVRTVHGDGYEVIPARDRAAAARVTMRSGISKAYRKAVRLMANTDQNLLTERERSELTETFARIGRAKSNADYAFKSREVPPPLGGSGKPRREALPDVGTQHGVGHEAAADQDSGNRPAPDAQ